MFDFKYSYNKHILPLILQWKYGGQFDKVETLGMFIGYPRSGHSLVGALLDAHPQMLFSQDLNILGLLQKPKFGRTQILGSVLERSKEFVEAGATGLGHHQSGPRYDFKVPNQYQGTQRGDLLVVGDKQAPVTTISFAKNVKLIDRLREVVKLRLRFVHMIRNPYANISGIYRVKQGRGVINSLDSAIEYYFDLCEGVAKIRSVAAGNIIDVKLEDLIANPPGVFEELCRFLGVSCPPDYVKDCSTVLFDRPKESASDVPWTLEAVQEVQEKIKPYAYLSGYEIPAKLRQQVGLA